MEDNIFILEYDKLFTRFMGYIIKENYNACLAVYDQKSFTINLQTFLHHYPNFPAEFQCWDEWTNLNEKVIQNGGKPLNYHFIISYQFTEILKEINIVSTHMVPKIDKAIPRLQDIIHNLPLLNDTLITGEMCFSNSVESGYVILIHGLKVLERLNIDGIGYFDSLDQNVKKFSGFQYGTVSDTHIYACFFTDEKNYTTDDFIIRLMASLRSFKRGDVKFSLVLSRSQGITNRAVYERFKLSTSSKDYNEQTDLFGSRPPMLIDISKDEQERFQQHMRSMINGLSNMTSCCEYFNYAHIASDKMLLPLSFISFESCFPSEGGHKRKKLANYSAFILDENDSFKKLVEGLYELRNCIIHNNQSKYDEVLTKLYEEGLLKVRDGSQIKEVLNRLFIALAARLWNPLTDIPTISQNI